MCGIVSPRKSPPWAIALNSSAISAVIFAESRVAYLETTRVKTSPGNRNAADTGGCSRDRPLMPAEAACRKLLPDAGFGGHWRELSRVAAEGLEPPTRGL